MIQLLALKVITVTLSVATPVVSFLGLRYLRRRWNIDVINEEDRQLMQFARAGVKFAEQSYKYVESSEEVNREKFNAVRNYVLRAAARSGIRVDEEKVRTVIERSVFETRQEQGKVSVSSSRSRKRKESLPAQLPAHKEPAAALEAKAQPLVAEAKAETPAPEEAKPRTVDPHDLTIIEGIGPKIAEALQGRNIKTLDQLAKTDVERLRQILNESDLRANPSTWPEQAQLAAAGKWEEFDALLKELRWGRRS